MHVTTVPVSLIFLNGQVGFVRQRGYDVVAVSSPGPELDAFGRDNDVRVHAVPMPRRITPLRDLASLVRLVRVMRRERPDIVHAHTPKGGLLGTMAAAIAGVPVRIYHMRGLPFTEAAGIKRTLLVASERVACALAHRVLAVSHSIRDIAVENGICAAERIAVPAGGSGQGVDADRFDPRHTLALRAQTRAQLALPADALVFGFVGRIVRDKGIVELEEAWRAVRDELPNARLLVVGPEEPQDPVPADVRARLDADPRVVLTGPDFDTPRLYAAIDVVVLPSYREGFPNVPLEAAAMALPVIATRVPGCVDAVADGQTGVLVPPRDAASLAHAMRALASDPERRRALGAAGRARVLREFRRERVWQAIVDVYESFETRHAGGARRSGDALKRVFDVLAATVGLVILSPVMIGVAIAVLASMGRPVLFRQTRPGRHGRPFTLHKFRTMRHATDAAGRVLPDGERLTSFGRFLRETSLDELPELWDVLRGRMSLVGPRPLLMEYLPLYSPEQARRHEVRPGITGLAQVSGRNAIGWDERFRLDVDYVDHRSLLLDLKILLRTIGKVVRREGINQAGQATMEPFRGHSAEVHS